MPAQDFDASAIPMDIVQALGLIAGTTYTCQNISTTATLFVREVNTMPTIQDRAFRIEAGANFSIKPDGVTPIWTWTDDPAGCAVVLDDAA